MYNGGAAISCWITVLLFGLLISDRTQAFIFPDLLRSGNRFQSRYKIAVLQEEPFLGVNGTGYVPDLLRLLAQWYASTGTRTDSDSFLYDIHPVDTWDQLLTTASATHWQVSFGLIAPSLTKTEASWKSLTHSHSAIHTGLQLTVATKRQTMASTLRGSNTTSTRQVATTTTLPVHSTGGVQFVFGGLDVKSAVFVALEGSPEAYVTQKYAGNGVKVKTVRNNDEALGYILRHPNSYLIKDSAVSDRMEEQFGSELSVVCKWRANASRAVFHHGFFGRDAVVIDFINDALRKLRSGEKDAVKTLNRKYFGQLRRTCLH